MKTEEQRKQEKLFRKISNKVTRTVREQNLIAENDHILVGLSGGKDSFLLLEVLAQLKKSLPEKFSLTAIHVSNKDVGYLIDIKGLEEFCKDLNIPFIHKTTITDQKKSKKSTCFICSWNRRKTIFNETKALNCNKLAFGHHRDDALQTLLMNMFYHGSISSLPYQLKMFDGRVHLIRPLMDLWEEEINDYAVLRKYPAVKEKCPYENQTKRTFTKEILNQINQTFPTSKRNIFHSLSNIYDEYLPIINKKSNS